MVSPDPIDLNTLIKRSQVVMSHAWMVRAYVRHADEAEEFPELMEIGRAVFDLSRALETRVADPPAYFQMLAKKLGKFRRAVEQFALDAPKASAHTNFIQAVNSIRACCEELDEILQSARTAGGVR